MTSPISAISGFSAINPADALSKVTEIGKTSGAAGTNATPSTSGTDFAGMLSSGLESVQNAQSKASDLAVQVANGTLADPAQYTMAATEASLGLQLTMAVRNKAVEAFQEIMRMQA
ncbi:flagellar hook-basal body complex protein FliE [Actinoplanes sp. NPDC049265]|uniref:flagellar hook-basal body complex protein FliE n=1 Tax=Actinoplanes sp. NPDC049265 TaxID=3363902 RepID=UPI00371F2E2D